MTSYGERDHGDTGAFLQQFTNSVSRALHKQTCTCNGRTYTADELRLKSNPAIFAPNFLEVFRRGNDSLPLIPGDTTRGATTGQKSPRVVEAGLKSYTKPKAKSEYEFEPLQRRGNPPRKVKMLGKASPTKRQRKEVNLPEKLDVVDKSGQNWQIVQDLLSKQHKRTSERLRPLDSSQVTTESLTPPNSSRIGRHQGDILSKHAPDGIPNQPYCRREADMDPERSALELEEPKMAHYQAPTRKVLEFTESPRSNPSSVPRYMPDQTNHKPMSMPDIRKGNITYKDYRGMLASLTRDGDVYTEISIGDPIGLNQPSRETGSLTLPSLNTVNNSNTTTRLNKSKLPLELESLYTRGGLKISTLRIDSEGTLPGDFLNRNKEELRQMYPMYDWRVANGARELGDRKGRNPPTIGTKETSTVPSMLQLPDKFSSVQHNSPREKSRFIGKRQNKKAVRSEKNRASERLDAVKEDLDKTGDVAAVLEQISAGQLPGEIRPASGLFPRQPPPTPMDGRRKRVADTQP
ncbi:uncharacterized protein LOC119741887 isoform X2 [Patiria miniata]|nr:uncharacterized protein LOC119741887 isoform X2 [Patiria miniata]